MKGKKLLRDVDLFDYFSIGIIYKSYDLIWSLSSILIIKNFILGELIEKGFYIK